MYYSYIVSFTLLLILFLTLPYIYFIGIVIYCIIEQVHLHKTKKSILSTLYTHNNLRGEIPIDGDSFEDGIRAFVKYETTLRSNLRKYSHSIMSLLNPPLLGFIFNEHVDIYKKLSFKQIPATVATTYGKVIITTPLPVHREKNTKPYLLYLLDLEPVISDIFFTSRSTFGQDKHYLIDIIAPLQQSENTEILAELFQEYSKPTSDNYIQDLRRMNIRVLLSLFFDKYICPSQYNTLVDDFCMLLDAQTNIIFPTLIKGSTLSKCIEAKKRIIEIIHRATSSIIAIRNKLSRCLLNAYLYSEIEYKHTYRDAGIVAMDIILFILMVADILSSDTAWILAIMSINLKEQKRLHKVFRKNEDKRLHIINTQEKDIDIYADYNPLQTGRTIVGGDFIFKILQYNKPIVLVPEIVIKSYTTKTNIHLEKDMILYPVLSEELKDRSVFTTDEQIEHMDTGNFGSGLDRCYGVEFITQYLYIYLYVTLLKYKITSAKSIPLNNPYISSVVYPPKDTKFVYQVRTPRKKDKKVE